ncbi:nonsense-mediated mRNA decay protein 3 [Xylona heveae TC161]|uniref:60S ribosomal export protein NMD3 n=1 Tax=Xylona heveae (strain CBS 132557 / TC161) TaxID=1328760 RepID=A0A165H9H8_XYLHT|nr:nonsense-mediated mRNA decay protein 3 [Xylona heveae TC161]KZF23172.1 nonsense-mediated mRNA decay protein 3 [Xylona heveae TC161]
MSMDLDESVPIAPQHTMLHQPQQPQNTATILCCNCGAPIDGTSSAGALCYDCIKLTIDITEGIQREATLHYCRDCERWLQPPAHWLVAAPESRELLALCLRKLRGLQKVRIIDAGFIWTEPHSRRIKLRITVQQEVFQGTILQQTFEVEFVQAYQQCPDCAKSYTANTWRAVVQVRQKVPHKRTFLYLEQLMLKHSAHKDTINIKETKDGLDFFYAQRNHAEKLVDFLNSVVPIRAKKSQELISMDIHTSSKSYKFTFSVEIVPICKDDLVVLPIKLAKSVGNITPMTLCHRVGTSVNLIDPNTLQTADISTPIYWREPFTPLADVQELVEFVVIDIEPLGPVKGRFVLSEATVARASDLGSNDQTYFCRTHLGGVLNVGDSVMGYHLTGTNFNNEHFEALEQSNTYRDTIPDVMLVKKFYARKKKNRTRNWRLKRMAKDEGELLPKKQDQERLENDFEMFLRDVEEDNELRNTLALYKNQPKPRPERMEGVEGDAEEEKSEDSEDEDAPKINMDELLEDFDELNMADQQ